MIRPNHDDDLRSVTTRKIVLTKKALDNARRVGDKLRVALLEDALNDLLNRFNNSCHG